MVTATWSSDEGRQQFAGIALAGISTLLATVSIGLVLSGGVERPGSAAPSLLLSTLTLVLNGLSLYLLVPPSRQSHPLVLGAALAALISPLLTGFAWSPAEPALVWAWLACLGCGSLALASVWMVRWAPDVIHASHSPAASEQQDDAHSAIRDIATPADQDVVQQMTRRDHDGRTVVEITATAIFAPGERHVALHLPLTPPLEADPRVECEPLDDSDVELAVTSVYRYGVRVEARRSGNCSEPLRTSIGVFVEASVGRAAA